MYKRVSFACMCVEWDRVRRGKFWKWGGMVKRQRGRGLLKMLEGGFCVCVCEGGGMYGEEAGFEDVGGR